MPKTPVSQHQKTAPGPPSEIAVATPMIFPVPMVAARATIRAPNWLTSPPDFLSELNDIFIAVNVFRCTKPVRKVRNKCVPKSKIIMGKPHKKELKLAKKSSTRTGFERRTTQLLYQHCP